MLPVHQVGSCRNGTKEFGWEDAVLCMVHVLESYVEQAFIYTLQSLKTHVGWPHLLCAFLWNKQCLLSSYHVETVEKALSTLGNRRNQIYKSCQIQMSNCLMVAADKSLIVDAFLQCSAKTSYQGRRMLSENWSDILHKETPQIIGQLSQEMNAACFHAALSSNQAIKTNREIYTTTNGASIMYQVYTPTLNGKSIKRNCYIALPPKTAEPTPPLGKSWHETILIHQVSSRFSDPIIEASKCWRRASLEACHAKRVNGLVESTKKHLHKDDDKGTQEEGFSHHSKHFATVLTTSCSFWDDNNKNSNALFVPADGKTIREGIHCWIDLLSSAHSSVSGHKDVFAGGDVHDNCTECDRLLICKKSMFVVAALNIALLEMPRLTWEACCNAIPCACMVSTSKGAVFKNGGKSFGGTVHFNVCREALIIQMMQRVICHHFCQIIQIWCRNLWNGVWLILVILIYQWLLRT